MVMSAAPLASGRFLAKLRLQTPSIALGRSLGRSGDRGCVRYFSSRAEPVVKAVGGLSREPAVKVEAGRKESLVKEQETADGAAVRHGPHTLIYIYKLLAYSTP
jgi:hypothetical protein